ncbi:MAG TPA: type II secretion system protein [Burkholderiaceae bacterium]|nr:type II secretion system protein [Burkholderiaceae bacterium]
MCISSKPQQRNLARAAGATLIEVVLFIVIISIAVASILGLMSLVAGRSADPVILRQSIAVAESMLQEILAQPFSTLDLDGGANGIGPEAGETRESATTPFDHVDDYHGFSLTGITTPDGAAISGLELYSLSVTVEENALTDIAAGDGLLVTVTATGPDGLPVSISGYRARVEP